MTFGSAAVQHMKNPWITHGCGRTPGPMDRTTYCSSSNAWGARILAVCPLSSLQTLCTKDFSLLTIWKSTSHSVPTEIEVSHCDPPAQPPWPLQDKLPSPVSIGNRPLQLLEWLADFRRAAWRNPDHKEGASWSVIIINTCRALSPSLVPLSDCYLVNCCYHCHHQLNNRV